MVIINELAPNNRGAGIHSTSAHHRASSCGLHREIHQGLGRDKLHNLDFNLAIPLKKAKDRDFAPGPAALELLPSSSSKIRLVELDFPLEIFNVPGLR